MIQSQQYSPFVQKPVSPSTPHNLLASTTSACGSSAMSGNNLHLQTQQQQQQQQQQQHFDNSQFGLFSPINGPMNSSESSMSSSPPLASPPSFVNTKRPSHSSSNLTNLAQQNPTNIGHSVSASSFFPTGSFPFSPQYSQNLNVSSNPASNSISTLNSQSQAKNSHMSGNPNVQQINNVGLLSAASTSNFFPNSISSIVEDAPSAKTNSLVALRVSNLPRDLQLREFNVLFTFAPDFVYTELLQSPALSDDGLPASVVGIGYFKSLPAASNAMAVLTRNPLIFAPREIFNRPNVSTSSFMLKCDIRTNVRQNEAVRGLGYNVSSQQQASQQQQSQQQQHNSTSPVAQLPQQPQQNVGPFKGSTSRFVFPSGGISTPQMELGAQNYPEAYIEPSGVLSPPSVFSPTSPRSIFPGEPEFMARISGKSLLLESQGKEDEEYSNMVKDPMGWFNMNNGYSGMPESNSSPVGFNGSAPMAPGGQSAQLPKPTQVTQPGQAQQAPVQSQGGIPGNTQSSSSNKDASSKTSSPSSGSNVKSTRNSISGAAPVNNNNNSNNNSNSNNSNGPPSGPNPWNDKRRGSTIRGFQNLSVSNDNNSKNGTFSPSSTASNSSAITSTAGSNSTSSNNNGSNGNSNDNNSNNNSNNSSGTSSAPVILPGGATRVLPPANPADQNPPCNTLYVGNLPPDTNEDELKDLFSARHGYKRLCFRTKANGPMCFVEFEDVSYAGQALEQLYGVTLSNSVKGGIRLSYSKNPLGVRSSTTAGGSNQSRISSGNNGNGNGNYGASRNYNSSNNY